MDYGICHLSIVAVRMEPNHASEVVTQLLFGDHFKIKERRKHWSKVTIHFDACEGWIPNTQLTQIDHEDYDSLSGRKPVLTADLVSHSISKKGILTPLVLGSRIDVETVFDSTFDSDSNSGASSKNNIVETAFLYLNTPYFKGGKTPFGIDSSGFTQMVYRISGHSLHRDVQKQAAQGDVLSFIEESEPGDLAFFDNNEGVIDHVGIILKNNHIIHAHGQVQIDRLDHTGIFNPELKQYSHKLRVIKKIVAG